MKPHIYRVGRKWCCYVDRNEFLLMGWGSSPGVAFARWSRKWGSK